MDYLAAERTGCGNRVESSHNAASCEELYPDEIKRRKIFMDNNLPLVSIIMPCRNEEKFIGQCLDSIINSDYPNDRLEILIGEGRSEDGTIKIIEKYIMKYPFIKLFDNPKKITPVAQNIGIKNAEGEIIIIMDVHSTYCNDYISKCVKYLKEYNADNVGGIIKTVPRNNSLLAKTIALALSHPFGAGNAYFRIGLKKVRQVDTVPFGCYKKDIFKKIGLFNEKIARGYEVDLNLRLKKIGGKILLFPDIVTYYYARANFKDFLKHVFSNGFWITYHLQFVAKICAWRHVVPLAFVLSLICSGILAVFSPIFQWLFLFILVLYCLVNLYSSVKISQKEKNFKYLFMLPAIFAALHITYGLASIWGLVKLLKRKPD
jgi:glycosyltransferase involved in cell wall biosynthesis